MIVSNLTTLAYATALSDSWWAPPVFVCCSVIFLGMMDLSSQLSDPFGDDAVDFDVRSWADEAVAVASSLLENDAPAGVFARALQEEGQGSPWPRSPRSSPYSLLTPRPSRAN